MALTFLRHFRSRRCCPQCGASFTELETETPALGHSIGAAFLRSAYPYVIVWMAVGTGWPLGLPWGGLVGICAFAALLFGAQTAEKRLTLYVCRRCQRVSRYAELIRP